MQTVFFFFFFFAKRRDSRSAVVSYWRKYVHFVQINRLGYLNLAKNSVAR